MSAMIGERLDVGGFVVRWPSMMSESDARWMLGMLEAAAAKLGVTVRQEALSAREDDRTFQGGMCVLRGRRLIVVDSRLSAAQKCRVLAAELPKAELSQIFLHPRVRQFLELERG